MKGFAVGAFKTVVGTVAGAGFGFLAARAGVGAFMLDGSDQGAITSFITGTVVGLGSIVLTVPHLKSKIASVFMAASVVASGVAATAGMMEQALTAGRVNNITQDRSLGYRGDCSKAGNLKFGSEVRYFLPQGCSLTTQ